MRDDFDQDAIEAAADLVRRSGAHSFEIGYLHDDVLPEDAGWYATAFFQGRRVISESVGAIEAAEGLARKLLRGAKCRRCGKQIQLNDRGRGCRWRRMGNRWEPGCGLPIDQSIPTVR